MPELKIINDFYILLKWYGNLLKTIEKCTHISMAFYLWIPDQSHLAGPATSGMTYVRYPSLEKRKMAIQRPAVQI